MAGAHCAAAATTTTYFHYPAERTLPVLACGVSTRFSSKPTKRKNHLRPKILKTLTKPFLSELTPTNLFLQMSGEEMKEQVPGFDLESSVDGKREEVEVSQASEFSVSETTSSTGLENGMAGNYVPAGSALEFGLGFVAACVLDVVWTVWMAKSFKSNKKGWKSFLGFGGWNGSNKSRSELQLKEKGNSIEIKNEVVVSAEESEMSKKIVQIRELAREAREEEKLRPKQNDTEEEEEEEEDGDDDEIVESGTKKGMGDRFVKLQKSTVENYKKLSLSPLWDKIVREDAKIEDVVDKNGLAAEEASKGLMFKKKHRFKSRAADAKDTNKPKGFMGRRDLDVRGMEMLRNGSSDGDELDSLDKLKQIDLPSAHVLGSVSMPLIKDNGRKLPAEESKRTQKLGNGRARRKREVVKSEPSNGRSWTKSSNVEAQSSGAFTQENQYASSVSKTFDDLSGNGCFKGKGGTLMANDRVGDTDTSIKPQYWWLSLPYVLAIFMRRGQDGEGPEGLFTLRSSSKDMGDPTFIITFEDRGEATNFCHIVESFFEELGDFSAEVVPVPMKELEAAVRLQSRKVVVVKKGQLQINARQSLTDVETSLRSLIGLS